MKSKNRHGRKPKSVNQIILELADQFLKIGESVIKRLKTTGGH